MGRPTDQERREAVKNLAERHGITTVDALGCTALDAAEAAGSAECTRLLQRAATNACVADNAGMLKLLCPLLSNDKPGNGRFWAYLIRMAAWKGSRECLEHLPGDLGFSPDGDDARLDAPDPECWFEVDDETEGFTPLTGAASAGHAECVRLLLHYGASPDLEDDIDETPLEAAQGKGREDCAKLIREALGKKNP